MRELGYGRREHARDPRIHRISSAIKRPHAGFSGILASRRHGSMRTAHGLPYRAFILTGLGGAQARASQYKDNDFGFCHRAHRTAPIIMVHHPHIMSELADLLERFRRGGELLAMATTGAAGPELDFKPAGNHMRVRQIIAEENPTLQYFDDDAWAEKLDYHKRKISHALENFRRLRTENHELLKDLPESAWTRSGTHSKDGPMSLQQVVAWYAQHLEDHVREIQAARAAYRQHRVSHPSPASA